MPPIGLQQNRITLQREPSRSPTFPMLVVRFPMLLEIRQLLVRRLRFLEAYEVAHSLPANAFRVNASIISLPFQPNAPFPKRVPRPNAVRVSGRFRLKASASPFCWPSTNATFSNVSALLGRFFLTSLFEQCGKQKFGRNTCG